MRVRVRVRVRVRAPVTKRLTPKQAQYTIMKEILTHRASGSVDNFHLCASVSLAKKRGVVHDERSVDDVLKGKWIRST